MAVSKGSGARSQRRLTARSKLRAIQAVLFTGHSPPVCTPNSSGTASGTGPVQVPVRALGGFLFCLAEMQELRLPSTEATLAAAVGFHLGEADAMASPSEVVPNPSPLVSTWLHDEGHHADVCELARDVLLAASVGSEGPAGAGAAGGGRGALTPISLAALWTDLFTCMVRNGHTKALLHSLAVCDQQIAALFVNPYLNNQLFKILSRVAKDTATRLDQVAELLTARQSATGSSSAKSGSTKEKAKLPHETTREDSSASSSAPSLTAKTHNVLLLSYNCSVGAEHWESPPEDVALTAARVARCWVVLGRTHTRFALDPSLLYARTDEQSHCRREFMTSLQETALHLLSAAQGVGVGGCASASAGVEPLEDRALRDVLAEAAQQCAVASFGVLRNLAEELVVLSVVSQNSQSLSSTMRGRTDKWLGIASLVGGHVVQFLRDALLLSASLARTLATGGGGGGVQVSSLQAEAEAETDSPLTAASAAATANSFRVLEALFAEFPDHILVLFLNQLCSIHDAGGEVGEEDASPSIVSKSLMFDDDVDTSTSTSTSTSAAPSGSTLCMEEEGGVDGFQFIAEIIRCCACCAGGGGGGGGGARGSSRDRGSQDAIAQKGKTFSIIFNWIFNA